MEDLNKQEDKLQQPKEKLEAMKELLTNEDIQKMWLKMHTPWVLTHKKVHRNDTCPFCDSGKKYKDCTCYQIKDNNKYKLDYKHTMGWR